MTKLDRKRSTCRTCGKALLENLDMVWETAKVPGPFGRTETRTWRVQRPAGDFGYRGTGICTLRCGHEWAAKHAPLLNTEPA